jgi:hypothetical protein
MSQWERLVTEGHARAARWRAAVKFLAAIAVCLIVLGLVGVSMIPRVQSSPRIAQAKQELVIARQRAITVFIADKGAPPAVLPVDAANAIRPDQAGGLIEQLLGSIRKNNSLPQEIKRLDPKVFWAGDWTPGSIAAVGGGRSILVGFYVNEAAGRMRPQFGNAPQEQAAPRLLRVFGLLHRSNDSWSFYCLTVPRVVPCGQLNIKGETIFPPTIPATLRELMPDVAFEAQKDARP